MRLRLTFAKTSAMRFTGHLDLHRTWERTLRRARLPLAYSKGYSPHPHINLASALPLGFTGEAEVIDIWLEKSLPIPEIQALLEPALPPGLQIVHIHEIDLQAPSLQTELLASEYLITFLLPVPDLQQRCSELLQSTTLPRQRREKNYDLRPLILDIQILKPEPQNHARILAYLAAREGATGRPEELASALGITPEAIRVHRVRLLFADRSQGNQQPPAPTRVS